MSAKVSKSVLDTELENAIASDDKIKADRIRTVLKDLGDIGMLANGTKKKQFTDPDMDFIEAKVKETLETPECKKRLTSLLAKRFTVKDKNGKDKKIQILRARVYFDRKDVK